MIARGACCLHLPDTPEPIALQGGDLVVFPLDARHIISSSLEKPKPDELQLVTASEITEGPSTALICGYFELNQSG